MIENQGVSSWLISILDRGPQAVADVRGSDEYPDIAGSVQFYQTECGVLVEAEVCGLPAPEGVCQAPVHGFHIHSGNLCSGNESDPFADALMHYNPYDCPHPHHAGDLPPLFANNGYAFQIFLTNRFSISEIIGKTVIVHADPDDFTTQPAGNSGKKIACGVIRKVDLG